MNKNRHCKRIRLPALDKIWFCGDVHGQYDLLLTALRQAGFNPELGHRLFACGDLIDVGPQSAQVIQLLQEPWFDSVEGNHERMMLQALSGWDSARYADSMQYLHQHGGMDILKRYQRGQAHIAELTAFADRLGAAFGRWLLKGGGGWFFSEQTTFEQQVDTLNALRAARLPKVIELRTDQKRLGVVHAQPLSDRWVDTVQGNGRGVEQILQWSRTEFQAFVGDGVGTKHRCVAAHVYGVDAVVFGHSIVQTSQPVARANRVYLDVGAKYGVMPCVMNAEEVLALTQHREEKRA